MSGGTQFPQQDLAEIQRAAALFLRPGSVCELRVPKSEREGTISGYFSDPAKLAVAAATVNGKGAGVYVTLNAVKPETLARADNRVKPRAATTTGDSEILHRNWVLFDFDPSRPAGISSTDLEHELALESARQCREYLFGKGWPEPVVADSGNGGHLLYRVDLPNDAESTELIKRVLKAAAQRYGTPKVSLDLAVFNAARISKLYGTVAAKGDSTQDRPHRVSCILDLPDSLQRVPVELLRELAAEVEPEPRQSRSNGAPGPPSFDVELWMRDYGMAVERGPVPHEGGVKWVLKHCPFNNEHGAPDAAIFQGASGAVGFKCFHASCAGKGWKELRALIEPERSYHSQPHSEPKPPADKPTAPPLIFTVGDLLTMQIPEPQLLIEGMIPLCGASLVNGASKSGKTLLAAQTAIAVASGTALFQQYRVLHPGPVLMLEQDDPAATASVKSILQRSPVPVKEIPFYLVPKVEFTFGPEFIAWLEGQITGLSLRLVVLDSYTALRGSRPKGGDLVKSEQSDMRALDELAKRTSSAILIVHHASKGSAALDWSQQAAGTFAMAASTESQIFVSRFPEMDGAASERLVRVRGRHSEDIEMVLRFRKETLDYEHVLEGGAATAYPLIVQIRGAFGGSTFSPKSLTHATGIAIATAHRQIERLWRAGALTKRGYGEYCLAVAQ